MTTQQQQQQLLGSFHVGELVEVRTWAMEIKADTHPDMSVSVSWYLSPTPVQPYKRPFEFDIVVLLGMTRSPGPGYTLRFLHPELGVMLGYVGEKAFGLSVLKTS